MPENPAALHVVGVTGTGRLMHTIRTPDGWTPFVDVLGPSAADQPDIQGYVTEVAAARVINLPGTGDPSTPARRAALAIAVLVSTQPSPLLFYRYADTGQWVAMGTATSVIGARRIAATAAYANLTGEAGPPTVRLHLAWAGRGGHLMTTSVRAATPDTDGQTVAVEKTAGAGQGAFRVPALAGVDAEPALTGVDAEPALTGVDAGPALTGVDAGPALAGADAPDATTTQARLVGLSASGRMYRSLVTSAGVADVLDDVETAGAGEAGEIVDAALAVAGGTEYYATVTGDGRILLAANDPAAGSWTRWRDLEEVDFVVVAPGTTMTYRDVAEFGTFARVALATTAEGLHVLGVTTSGRLLHQLQADHAVPAGCGQEFRDVELAGVGTDVGEFIAIAAA